MKYLLSQLKPQQLFVIKYGLLVINLFLMIITIRTYVNYITILQAIDNTRLQIVDLDKEISHIEYIEKPYLQSSRALIFLAHESNKRLPGERFIQLIPQHIGSGGGVLTGGLGYTGDSNLRDSKLSDIVMYESPQDARASYFKNLSR